LDKKDVEILGIDTPFKGFKRIDRYRLRHRLFSGGWGQEIEREVFECGHGVVVVPFDPVLDKVVLVEQFRHGKLAALSSPWFDDSASPWTLECVAGNIAENEQPEDVAKRELMEEAGCSLSELVPVGQFLLNPGGSSHSVYIFCARIDASSVGGIHGVEGEGEDIRVFTETTEDVFEMIYSGKISGAGSVIGLQWLNLNKEKLCNRWLGKK